MNPSKQDTSARQKKNSKGTVKIESDKGCLRLRFTLTSRLQSLLFSMKYENFDLEQSVFKSPKANPVEPVNKILHQLIDIRRFEKLRLAADSSLRNEYNLFSCHAKILIKKLKTTFAKRI